MKERSGLLMVAEGACKTASIKGKLRNYKRTLFNRNKSALNLLDEGYFRQSVGEHVSHIFGDDPTTNANYINGTKLIAAGRALEKKIFYTRAATGAGALALTGAGIYAATRDNEKTSSFIPYGLMTFMTSQMGEQQMKHGISEGIRGIRNMLKYKPSSKPSGPRMEKAKNFVSNHADAINHLTDADKWQAAGRLVNDVSSFIR